VFHKFAIHFGLRFAWVHVLRLSGGQPSPRAWSSTAPGLQPGHHPPSLFLVFKKLFPKTFHNQSLAREKDVSLYGSGATLVQTLSAYAPTVTVRGPASVTWALREFSDLSQRRRGNHLKQFFKKNYLIDRIRRRSARYTTYAREGERCQHVQL
jgi:hypothetical protein